MEPAFDWLSPPMVNELFAAITTHVLLAGSGGACLESSQREEKTGKKQMD